MVGMHNVFEYIKVTMVRVCVYTLAVKSEECGGLLVPSNTYSLSKDDHLYDVENGKILIRNLI